MSDTEKSPAELARGTHDPERVRQWLLTQAERTVSANGSRATHISDMFFDGAEAIKKLQAANRTLNEEVLKMRDTIETIKAIGSIPAEDVASCFIHNESNNPFSPMSRARLARQYKYELSTDSELDINMMHARLTEVIRRARVDGANSVREGVDK